MAEYQYMMIKMFFSMITSIGIYLVLMVTLLERKHGLILQIGYVILRLVMMTSLYCEMAFPGSIMWLQGMNMEYAQFTLVVFLMIWGYATLLYTFKGDLLKIILAQIIAETAATPFQYVGMFASNVAIGQKDLFGFGGMNLPSDLLIPIVAIALFLPFYFLFRPVLLKFRKIKLRRKVLWAIFITAVLTYSTWANLVIYLQNQYQDVNLYVLVSVIFLAVGLIGITLAIGIYRHRLAESKAYLLRAKSNMDRQYALLREQVSSVESAQKKLAADMENVEQLKQEVSSDEALRSYLENLEANYKKVSVGTYSNDYSIDSILCYGAGLCEALDIPTDFSAQQYVAQQKEKKEANAQQESTATNESEANRKSSIEQMLLELLDWGIEENKHMPKDQRKMRLHIATIRGRIIIDAAYYSQEKYAAKSLCKKFKPFSPLVSYDKVEHGYYHKITMSIPCLEND